MAEGKTKIICYADWIEIFEALEDDEAGRLAKHFFRYVNDLNPVSDRLTELSFIPIKQTLKRDLQRYLETCNKNSSNGKLGGRPKKAIESEENPNKPNGFLENPKKAKKADNDNDSDSDSVKDNNTIPTSNKSGVDFDFDRFLIFFNQTLGKKHKLINDSVRSKIKARLKEGYTKHDFQSAIVNIAKEKHHIETGFKHVTPEFISRPDKLEMYISRSEVDHSKVYVEPKHCDY